MLREMKYSSNAPPPMTSDLKAAPQPPTPTPGPGAPPRPPPVGLKPLRPAPLGSNHPLSCTSALVKEGETVGPKTKRKPFFWEKVLANPDDSMVWNQIKSGSFQFDEEMIEFLFGYAPAGKNRNEAKKESPSHHPSMQSIRLINPEKAENLHFQCRALSLSTEEVCDALEEGNELPSVLIQILLKLAPTTDEELKLRLYHGELSELYASELFLRALVTVPFAFKRLELLLFMCTFEEITTTLKESFIVLEAACTELRESRLFLKLLEAVLKTENHMNGGTQAFKLDTLLKLSCVKGTDGKTTISHNVVRKIIRFEGNESDEQLRISGLQVVSGIGNELQNVKKAAVLDASSLTETVAKLGHMLTKSRDFLNSNMKNVEVDKGFYQTLRNFVQSSEFDVRWLLEEEKRIMTLVKNTSDYFQGNAGKNDEGLRLFLIVHNFLDILDKCTLCNKGLYFVQ